MSVRKHNQIRAIGDLCDFENGNGFSPNDWRDDGLPIIRIQNLNGSRKFNYFGGTPNQSWIVEPGELLFAWAGVKGVSFGPTIWGGPRGVLNQHIYRIRAKEGVDKTWLHYALRYVTDSIESKAHGFKTSLVHVRKSDITGATVVLPSYPEQKKIAAMMSKWDQAENVLTRLVGKKAQSLRHKKNQLLHHPDSDRAFEFRELFKKTKQRASNQTEAEVLSVTRDGVVRQSEYFNKDVTSEDRSQYLVVKRGQLVMSGLNFWMGAIDFQNVCDEGIVSPAYRVFDLVSQEVDTSYMQFYVRSELMRRALITASVQGASIVRRNLDTEALDASVIKVPSLQVQQKIAHLLADADAEIHILEETLQRIRVQKRALLKRVLGGDWPMTEAA